MAWSSKYTIEFWDKNGVRLADYSGKAFNRQIVLSRNRPDDISFHLDLNDFEKYCRKGKVDPNQILKVNSTEVRVRRYGKYLAGGQLVYKNPSINAQRAVIDCRVKGFLWLFSKRFTGEGEGGLVSEVHTAEAGTAKSRKALVQYLVETTQALPNGDFGVTIGSLGGSDELYDKTFRRTNLLTHFQNASELDTDPIDIWIDARKALYTAEHQGSDRPEVVFEYPGNIIGLDAPEDGTDTANEIISLGEGAQDGSGVVRFAVDEPSQLDYQLRQDVLQSNGSDDSDNGVTDAANAALRAKKTPINIPNFTLNGNKPPFIGDYGIGDRIKVKVTNHEVFKNINGAYRIEKLTLTLDDGDNETIVPEVSAI